MMRKNIAWFLMLLFSLQLMAQQEGCGHLPEKKAKKYFKKAMDNLQNGRYADATKYLQEAVDADPEYLKAWWVLADINSRYTNRMRRRALAKEAYEHIIDLCPSYENYYAYYYLGQIYYTDSMFKQAHQMFEAFLNSDDDNIKEKHFEEAQKLSRLAQFYDEIFSRPVPFNPVKLKGVSSSRWDEYLPVLTPDNEYLYFTRRMEQQQISGYSRADNRVERFSVAKRIGPDAFDQGHALPAPFNKQPNEGGATLTIDNKHLYYTRCKVVGVGMGRKLDCNICRVDYQGGSWSDIVELGPAINTPDYWESMPSISSDGKTLYFVSNRKEDNFGGYDIYVARQDNTGHWQKAVNMGPAINTPGNEKSPFIHTDSQTLYFSSASRTEDYVTYPGHRGLGGYDIFFTRLDSNNSWIEPKNIGYPINTAKNDIGFSVSTDGKHGFFASNRFNKDKNWDIYSFELYKNARPQKVLFLKGVLKDDETNEVVRNARIEIQNVKTKEIKHIDVDDEGRYAVAMVFKNDVTLTVKKRDYVYLTRYISKNDQSFDKPLTLNVKMQPIRVGRAYKLQDIHFATDSASLTPHSLKVVEKFSVFLNENPNIHIEIQGHTDNVGSAAYNLKLSERRAQTVYNYLVHNGIDASRMSYHGYGESQPVASNNTEEGRRKNRRTVFVITRK